MYFIKNRFKVFKLHFNVYMFKISIIEFYSNTTLAV